MMDLSDKVGALREVSNKVHNAELKLFMEVEFGLLLLSFVWRLLVKSAGKPIEILSKFNEMGG